MGRPNMGNIQLGAEAFREGGVWRLRLIGPEWLLTDLEHEIAETGQQLDIVATVSEAGKDQMFGHDLASIDLAIAPRRKRAKPRRRQRSAVAGPNMITVDRAEFLKP